MPTENPYKSPESDSTPQLEPSPVALLHRKFPTWRFWALVLICIPGFLVFTLPIPYFADKQGPVRNHYYYTLPYSIVVLFFLAICALLFVYWRSAARIPNVRPFKLRIGIFSGTLAVLSLFAATSAFTTICTTMTLASRSASSRNGFGSMVILILSPIGVFLVLFLARGLYLDAIGRPKKPTDDEVQRPIPRLRARPPIERD